MARLGHSNRLIIYWSSSRWGECVSAAQGVLTACVLLAPDAHTEGKAENRAVTGPLDDGLAASADAVNTTAETASGNSATAASPERAPSARDRPSAPQVQAEAKPGEKQTSERRLGSIIGAQLAGVASQVAILTAVLFFFGWVRTNATYHYFGVDVSALSFSASDYVLRSVDAAFPTLIVIGLIGTCALAGHAWLRPRLDNEPDLVRRVVTWAGRGGVALVLAGFLLALALTGPNGSDIWGPLILLVGFASIAYALGVRNSRSPSEGTGYLVAVIGMALVAFLWTVTAYASYIGVQKAEQAMAGLPRQADVIVYSTDSLPISGPGISASRVPVLHAEYHFRYDGLRLLVSSGGQYFLLPSRWRPGDGPVVVLPVTDPGILVEFTVTKLARAG